MENMKEEQSYTCSSCNEVLYEDDIAAHGCLNVEGSGEWEQYLDEEEEPEIEYLESEGSDSDNVEQDQALLKDLSGEDWPESEIRRLLVICMKHVGTEPNTASLSYWKKVERDFNENAIKPRSLSTILATFRVIERTWKKILQENTTVVWAFTNEMRLLDAAKQNKFVAKVEINSDSNEDSQKWTKADTECLIEAYKNKIPMFYQKGRTEHQVWRSIISELDSNLKEKHSENDMKNKMTQLRKTYFTSLAAHGNGNLSHVKWSFKNSMDDLIKEERRLEKLYIERDSQSDDDDLNDPFSGSDPEYELPKTDVDAEDDPLEDSLRWTGRETINLIKEYKKHVRSLVMTPSFKGKRKIWEKIAANVVMKEPRKCNPYVARMKIVNLKKTWEKHKKGLGRATWGYYTQMADAMEVEANALKISQGQRVVARHPSPSSAEETDPCPPKRKRENYESWQQDQKENDDEPVWFSQYRSDVRRRHEQKMQLKLRILDALEGFVEKIA